MHLEGSISFWLLVMLDDIWLFDIFACQVCYDCFDRVHEVRVDCFDFIRQLGASPRIVRLAVMFG